MKVSLDAIKKEWKSRGFPPEVWIDPPGQVWENYIHTVDELLLVFEGKLELVIDGKTLYPETGEEIFIPANVYHSVHNIGGTTAKWLYAYKIIN